MRDHQKKRITKNENSENKQSHDAKRAHAALKPTKKFAAQGLAINFGDDLRQAQKDGYICAHDEGTIYHLNKKRKEERDA